MPRPPSRTSKLHTGEALSPQSQKRTSRSSKHETFSFFSIFVYILSSWIRIQPDKKSMRIRIQTLESYCT